MRPGVESFAFPGPVYKHLCPPASAQGEPMRIVYRMRGLLGDATEEFIESLDSTTGRPFPQTLLRVGSGSCPGM